MQTDLPAFTPTGVEAPEEMGTGPKEKLGVVERERKEHHRVTR